MNRYLGIGNLLFYLLVLVVNYLANALPLNNLTTGQVSDAYPSLFTPAGFTFGIWGLIYLLLGIFVIAQLGNDRVGENLRRKVGPWFILSCIFNVAWLFAWHYQLFLFSLIFMLLLLFSLVLLYLRTHEKSGQYARAPWYTTLPFSVYLGWIMVATVANVSIYLMAINWNRLGFTDSFWTVIVIFTALAIFSLFLYIRRDPFVMGVFIWASGGILYRHIFTLQGKYLYIIIALAFSLGVSLTALFITRKR